MALSIGNTHSLAVNQKGRLYTWGWNDNGQCARDPDETSVQITTAK